MMVLLGDAFDAKHLTNTVTGEPRSLEFRVQFHYNDHGQLKQISPWHDIPLYTPCGNVNMVVEIPKCAPRLSPPPPRCCARTAPPAPPRPPPPRPPPHPPPRQPPRPPPPSPPRCPRRRWSRAKFEIATGEEFNPIKQDTKNGKLRDYKCGGMRLQHGHTHLLTLLY